VWTVFIVAGIVAWAIVGALTRRGARDRPVTADHAPAQWLIMSARRQIAPRFETRGSYHDPMDWSAAVAGSALLCSICFAVILFGCLGLLFGHDWRTGAVAILAVVAVNVFYPGGAPRVIATILRPFHMLATLRPPPDPPAGDPSHWPNG
jgi:hypothetical protein